MGDYGGAIGDMGFGGPAPGSMGDAPSMSDAGLGFGFGDVSFGDSALSSMPDITNLTDIGLEGLMSFDDALSSVPSFSTDNSFMSTLQDLSKQSKAMAAIMGLFGKSNTALSAFASTPVTAALAGKNAPSSIANSAINSALASMGPVGMGLAALNGITGFSNGITGALNGTNAPASFQGNDANMGIGDALPGLAGMYAGYQGMRDSSKMLGGLQDLYSQNSPYAQMLRQQLQRKDAAGGRRSQYGPREVELQAKLAQMASGQIGAMSQLQQRQNINRAQMMQQGLGAFQKMGGIKGLQSLFGMGGMGGMFDTAASQGLQGLPNLFANNGMDSFGQLPEGLGFDFGLPPFGG
jgi:hypothetical protein